MAGVNAERFNREIELAAGLQHPHVVRVLSAGRTAGAPYYTMPFVEDDSLRARPTRDSSLPMTEVIGILRDVAKALAYALAGRPPFVGKTPQKLLAAQMGEAPSRPT